MRKKIIVLLNVIGLTGGSVSPGCLILCNNNSIAIGITCIDFYSAENEGPKTEGKDCHPISDTAIMNNFVTFPIVITTEENFSFNKLLYSFLKTCGNQARAPPLFA